MSPTLPTRPLRTSLLVLALASVCALGLGRSVAAEAAPVTLGFNESSWGNPRIPKSTMLRSFVRAHSRMWRFGLSWQYFEPAEGIPSAGYFAMIVEEYNQALASGQTPLFMVMGTPYWALTEAGKGTTKGSLRCAANNLPQCNAPPDVRDAHIAERWKLFLQIMAYFMPKATFEIWNEPNIDWGWMQPQDPELYGLMLKTAHEAIKAVRPGTSVISGSVNNYAGPDTAMLTNYTTFLPRMYASAGKGSFDGLGFHAYPCATPANALAWPSWPATVLAAVRSARDGAGDHNKPLWLTEVGATTGAPDSSACGGVFTELTQGPALSSMITWAESENDAHGDMPVFLINSLFNVYPRTNLWGTSNGLAQGEFGLIAWLRNPLTGAISFRDKPAMKIVSCRYAGYTNCLGRRDGAG